MLYTRYPIVARALGDLTAASDFRPSARARAKVSYIQPILDYFKMIIKYQFK